MQTKLVLMKMGIRAYNTASQREQERVQVFTTG